jgi:hypothetical protein
MTQCSPEIAALEQIAIVCTDNMDRDCDHRMALDFVRQIANDCLASAPAQAAPDWVAADLADDAVHNAPAQAASRDPVALWMNAYADAHLQLASLKKAAGKLVDVARTSGGVAGRDEDLCSACDVVEGILSAKSLPTPPQAAGEHASWTDEDYCRARDCMLEILRMNNAWSITKDQGEKEFDNAFQHAVGILSLTARQITVPQAAWQPIETAPKDGTRILATIIDRPQNTYVVRYRESSWQAGPLGEWVAYPTHWQPLPAPLSRPQRQVTDGDGK